MELEASTINSPGALAPPRIAIGPRLLRLRSDEQLVALFRSGHDEAFQVIYDRYHKRLAGYARQMLPRGHDPDDVLQDVFVRAYRALRHDDRELAVRPWLFRVAHNCCIDELRRNVPTPSDELYVLPSPSDDLTARVDARETLRRLIEDIGRLPEQQRSALLLRELSGVSYAELAVVLDTTVPAVKSLLVRARMGLVRAGEARDTACSDIREQLVLTHDQGVRAAPTVRRHLQGCPACRSYRGQMCAVNKRMAALLPAGPLAALARMIGLPGASGTGSMAALGASGTVSGAALGANHVATLVAAALATAGGAVGIEHVIVTSAQPHRGTAIHRSHRARSGGLADSAAAPGGSYEAQSSEGASSYVSGQASGSGTGVTAVGGAGRPSASSGTGTAAGGSASPNSPTPTAPPGWGSTGPPPTVRPTPGDTGPTPSGTGADGTSGSPTPTTDDTGPTPTSGQPSGTPDVTSTGSTGATGGSTGSSSGTSTTDAGTSPASDPGATTASASAGSAGTAPSTSSSTTSTGTGS